MIGNHAPMDTSNHEPDPSLETTLRVLEVFGFGKVLKEISVL